MASQVKQTYEPMWKEPRKFPKRFPSGFPVGPRTERRAKENAKLAKLKISRCEVQFKGVCVDRIMLSWAHATKSRYLITSKDWQTACRCCLPCHSAIESMSHTAMAKIVREAIAKRKKGGRNDAE